MLETHGKPKNPMSSFIHFCVDKRKTMEAMPVAESGKILGSQWRALTEQQRASYNKMMEDGKAQHEKDMKRWTAKMEKKGLMEAIEVARSRVSALKKE
jgi:hypothetical protein